MWCSSRSRTASLPAISWSSPTASPAATKNPAGRASALGTRGRTRRRSLYHRRQGRPHLASDLRRRSRPRHRGGAVAGTGSKGVSGVLPPEGIHPEAGNLQAALPVPMGSTSEQVALGKKIFDGEVAGATCAGCHGANGNGTPLGADLTSGKWLWGDGSLAAITDFITNGVPSPRASGGDAPDERSSAFGRRPRRRRCIRLVDRSPRRHVGLYRMP